MANSEHLAILKSGVDAWNRWRKNSLRKEIAAASVSRETIEYPDLQGADLQFHFLEHANLSEANLSGANLLGAHLSYANLQGADLRGSYLYHAELGNSILWDANLAAADLTEAQLYGAHLEGADLTGTRFHRAVFGRTSLGMLDLGSALGLEEVKHIAPSTIGIETLYRSQGNLSVVFLREAGIPEALIHQTLPFASETSASRYSCFISHSSQDKEFCDRLWSDLRRAGVRCWYFPEAAVLGRGLWAEIDQGISTFDKMILVCSAHSLQSGPVMRELKRALAREDAEARDVLFPITLDNEVFTEWQHPFKIDVLAKVIGDFRGWNTDPAKYLASLHRLLEALDSGA
jgi:uncharacterized protein YjbI with pentapeptide repeats